MRFNDSELLNLITTEDPDKIESLFEQAGKVRKENFGRSVYIRGLIEFTNYCKNDCYYCGLRCSNKKIERYRLSPEEILNCCREGDKLGLKTFVLQGGEDPWFTPQRIVQIVSAIREEFPEHAVTLSLGERPKSDFELFFKAGANRYLLRHESACESHYSKLHPPSMNLSSRKMRLWELKQIGFQTGAGFMVGAPWQTPQCLLLDLRFLEELQPQMVGIGPFIAQKDTPFGKEPSGSLQLCLKMLALARLILPRSLLPATTAMETIAPNGRELALKVGANVVMPNISPLGAKKLYAVYDNKAFEGEASTTFSNLKEKIIEAGFLPDMSRGDFHLE